MRIRQSESRAILARNIDFLFDRMGERRNNRQLARDAKLAAGTVDRIWREPQSSPTLETVDCLAQALHVTPWLLLMPQMPRVVGANLRAGALIDLLEAFAGADEKGRELIGQVAERTASYSVEKNASEPGGNPGKAAGNSRGGNRPG